MEQYEEEYQKAATTESAQIPPHSEDGFQNNEPKSNNLLSKLSPSRLAASVNPGSIQGSIEKFAAKWEAQRKTLVTTVNEQQPPKKQEISPLELIARQNRTAINPKAKHAEASGYKKNEPD